MTLMSILTVSIPHSILFLNLALTFLPAVAHFVILHLYKLCAIEVRLNAPHVLFSGYLLAGCLTEPA